MQIKKFRDLYLTELQELHSMERQLGVTLRHMAEAATSARLANVLMRRHDEAQVQQERLDYLLRRHVAPRQHTDKALQALALEAQKTALLLSTNALRDAGLVASSQKLAHYEIAAYGAALTLADQLGLGEDRKILHQNLEEEERAERDLAQLARDEINPPAAAADTATEEAEEAKAEEEGKPMPMEPVTVGPLALPGFLTKPKPGYGMVLFAHGTGSSRLSPRNRFAAAELHKAGFGTLLFDLLIAEEAFHRANVFDIPLLARRLLMATEWLGEREDTQSLEIGYFGASTGAAA
ncbi:MAG TPA: DUF892 family protein, partial [Stellaceae bacterium]|nr:DUF892 family protein [Stellaceae bacterium]